jgi:hypothetical protein
MDKYDILLPGPLSPICMYLGVQEPQITQQNISPPALFFLPSIAMHSALTPCSTGWAMGHSRLIIYPYPDPMDTYHGELLCYLNTVSGLGVSVSRDDRDCKHHPFLVTLFDPADTQSRPSPSCARLSHPSPPPPASPHPPFIAFFLSVLGILIKSCQYPPNMDGNLKFILATLPSSSPSLRMRMAQAAPVPFCSAA